MRAGRLALPCSAMSLRSLTPLNAVSYAPMAKSWIKVFSQLYGDCSVGTPGVPPAAAGMFVGGRLSNTSG